MKGISALHAARSALRSSDRRNLHASCAGGKHLARASGGKQLLGAVLCTMLPNYCVKPRKRPR